MSKECDCPQCRKVNVSELDRMAWEVYVRRMVHYHGFVLPSDREDELKYAYALSEAFLKYREER